MNWSGLRSCWWLCLLTILAMLAGCNRGPKPGHVLDEARRAGRTAASFPPADEDYFHDMDGAIPLSGDEVKGRNMWIVWTGGNDKMWDGLTTTSVGTLDFLKTISSHPGFKFGRDNRWDYLGLVNEPCFKKATGPDPQRFGLWLDVRDPNCPADPFENEAKYPGVKLGARGDTVPVGSYYGYATGIVGLRLFPNPDFDKAAAAKWDAERYYNDPSYYNDKNLVRPYRVGMSCGFCHVGPNPVKPPADPENPKWENLSSNVGAQYFWVDRIFTWEADETSFPFQLFHTSRPGSLDTSLISTDSINNPRTMNAVYNLWPRLEQGKRWGKETLTGGEKNNKQFNDFVREGPLTEFFQSPDTVYVPRVLKDGSDSVGALGALNRVYLNIGLFSEEWLLHFRALVGGQEISPIEIAVANKNSAYWEATEMQTPDMALFFVKSTTPHKLADAPGGAAFLTTDKAKLERGKMVFAERCARCHSSKIPEGAPAVDDGHGCSGKGYLDCWNQYWAWTKTEEFKSQMRKIVEQDDFLKDNYLSTELRVPETLLQTNACSSLATNAIKDNIWDNFSSSTYKELPSIGTIQITDPFTGAQKDYQMPGGGRGYIRPASLISAWSTAPFLQNNVIGKFNPSPSVQGRMDSFNDSIQQMLWPERRPKDAIFATQGPGAGIIDRTTAQSYLRIAPGYLPDFLKPMIGFWHRWLPWLFGEEEVQIGPIPKGTPVNLLSNLDILGESRDPGDRIRRQEKVLSLLIKMKGDLESLPPNVTDAEANEKFKNLVPQLLELNKCPDFVVNRGHYFGTSYFQEKDEAGLSDEDKLALIEFIKTF